MLLYSIHRTSLDSFWRLIFSLKTKRNGYYGGHLWWTLRVVGDDSVNSAPEINIMLCLTI